jgi:hypothetical protein
MNDTTRNEVQVDLDKYQAMLRKIDELEDAASEGPAPAEAPVKYAGVKALASAIDSWRIFPRVFISTYIYLLYMSATWFMALEAPTMEQAGLISVIVGAGAAWFGLYSNSGSPK